MTPRLHRPHAKGGIGNHAGAPGSTESSGRKPSRRQPTSTGLTWVGLSLTVLLSSLNTSIVNVALPVLADAFQISSQAVQWTVICFLLAITASIVSAGRLADVVGRKRLLLVGLVLFTAAAAACGFAPSLGWLIAARFLQGLGASVMMAISIALVGELTPGPQAGRVMGLLGSMSAVGTALGPSIGGLLIAAFGWPAIFHLSVPFGLVALALLWRYLPPDRRSCGAKFSDIDPVGTVILAMSLTAYALAMTRWSEGFGRANALLLAIAAGGLLLFAHTQKRSASPLLRIELLQDPALRSRLALSLLMAAVMMATLVVGPFYLSQSLRLNTATLGLVMSAGPLAAAAIAIPGGRIVDRVGARCATVVGLAGAAVGSLAMATLSEAGTVVGYLLPLTLMTSGYALFQTANNTAVMQGAAPGQRGLISGLLNLSRNLGLVTGASFLGAVFASVLHAACSPGGESVAAATRATFATASGVVGVALVVAFRSVRANPATKESARESIS